MRRAGRPIESRARKRPRNTAGRMIRGAFMLSSWHPVGPYAVTDSRGSGVSREQGPGGAGPSAGLARVGPRYDPDFLILRSRGVPAGTAEGRCRGQDRGGTYVFA